MKALGLNQSALARRMNVSRAYVSKVFAGDVNISFQTACRFAKALEMDFMPGLAPKKESGARQGVRGVVAAVFCALAFACQAEVFSVPSWLPEDQRFEVSGTSNEIAQVEQTLAAMRDAFHPKLIAMMRHGDSATNGYPSAMGPTLEWIVHVSLPAAATNETVYFNSYKDPLSVAAFGDSALLINRASRLSYLPPRSNLSLVYDEYGRNAVSRAIPGVDYPGVAYEDEGSTSERIRLVLSAPKNLRRFRVRSNIAGQNYQDVEFQWVALRGGVDLPHGRRPLRSPNMAESVAIFYGSARRQPAKVAVFAREKGRTWGTPAYMEISADPLSVHTYVAGAVISCIDYGSFKDVYRCGENNVILGFTRYLPGKICGEEYSNLGERIIDSYSDDQPKTTRKVKYYVDEGKLLYKEEETDVHHENAVVEDRAARW